MDSTGARLTNDQLRYFAGWMDGEGCFGYRETPFVRATNTYKPILLELRSAFGGSVCLSQAKAGSHRTIFQWQTYGATALDVCVLLLPHLKEKAPQAALVIMCREASLVQRPVFQNALSALKRIEYGDDK